MFELLGDFGGFSGAILIAPSYFLTFYSSRMFASSIVEDLPKNKKRKRKAKHNRKLNNIEQ